jgi:hypothetical protein
MIIIYFNLRKNLFYISMDIETIILIVFSSFGTALCIFSGICAYLKHREEYITDKDLTKDLLEKV